MARTRIKICGVCRPEDAALAVELGADAIGMVLHTGMGRSVTGSDVRAIMPVVPAFVSPVLLFVDDKANVVKSIANSFRVTHVQLNGQEDADYIHQLKPLRVIRSVRVTATLGEELARWRQAIADHKLSNLAGFVLESATPLPGGSGIANDWNAVIRHQQAGDFTGLPPIIAAGGLTPETVGDVVRTIRPFAVDVSSGVETVKRAKDAGKLRAFFEAVREADRAIESA